MKPILFLLVAVATLGGVFALTAQAFQRAGEDAAPIFVPDIRPDI
jgi:hypothetical protein